jgi:cell division septum initiation protein DivIVA
MQEAYIPNEKYRGMFGLDASGYSCERVDLYLGQLETAFKKLLEINDELKEQVEQAAALPALEQKVKALAERLARLETTSPPQAACALPENNPIGPASNENAAPPKVQAEPTEERVSFVLTI